MKKNYFLLILLLLIVFFIKTNTLVMAKSLPAEDPPGLTYDYIPMEEYELGSIKTTLKNLSFTAKPSPTPTEIPPPPEKIYIPEPTEIPTPIPTAVPVPTVDANSDAVWDSLAQCESGGNWNIDTGNGYFGGLQFTQGAWESVGGSGSPAHASREDQIAKGKILQQRRGWGAWGGCARKLGL